MSPWPAPKRVTCGQCNGNGTVPDPQPGDRKAEKACPQCNGDGEL